MVSDVTLETVERERERACSLQNEKTQKISESCLNKLNSIIKYVKNKIEIKNKDRPMLC